MQCSHCGTKMHPKAERCFRCGANVASVQVPHPHGVPGITPSEVVLLSALSLVEPTGPDDIQFRYEGARKLVLMMMRAALLSCESEGLVSLELMPNQDKGSEDRYGWRIVRPFSPGLASDEGYYDNRYDWRVRVINLGKGLAFPPLTLEARICEASVKVRKRRLEGIVVDLFTAQYRNPADEMVETVLRALTTRELLVEEKGVLRAIRQLLPLRQRGRKLTDAGLKLASQYPTGKVAEMFDKCRAERHELWRSIEPEVFAGLGRMTAPDTTGAT